MMTSHRHFQTSRYDLCGDGDGCVCVTRGVGSGGGGGGCVDIALSKSTSLFIQLHDGGGAGLVGGNVLFHINFLSEKSSGESTTYVNSPFDHPQTNTMCPKSDVGPYANQSVLIMDNTFRDKGVSQNNTQEVSPYENVHQPGEYESLGSSFPKLPTVYHSLG